MKRRVREAAAAVEAWTTDLTICDETVPGRHGPVPVRRYQGNNHEPRATLVWVHGGAFSHGGLEQLESHAVAAALASEGVRVYAVDYRLAPPWSWFRDAPPGRLPGIRYPVPVDDVDDAVTAVAERHRNVALGGASAGACLSASVALRRSSERRDLPTSLLLAYGTFHARLPPLSSQLRSRIRGVHAFAQFSPTVVRRMNHNYAGSPGAMNEPFAFPGGHDLTGVPPALVLDADRDSLRASGEAFERELRKAGVAVKHHVVANSTHGFLNRPGTAQFDEGIRHLNRYLHSSKGIAR